MIIGNQIHPTAIVDPQAHLGEGVRVGPYAIIEKDVTIGDDTEIMAGAQILRFTTIGRECNIHHHAVLGGLPQDLSYDGQDTYLVLGNNNAIREFVTLNRASKDGATRIGNNCYIMAYAHLGHNGQVGDGVILANGVQVGGYSEIGDYASIGGGTPVHQFCKVGAHAFIGGGYRIVQDVPPFILAMGEPLRFSGLNVVGLKRRNIAVEARGKIKRAYKYIYRSELNVSRAVERIEQELADTPEIQTIIDFVKNSTRGLI